MMRTRAPLPGLACLLCWSSGAVADLVEDVTKGWYAVEVIVFQRTGVTAANSTEQLERIGGRSFPAGIRSISAGKPGDGYRLTPYTRATLEFPRLSFACAPSNRAESTPPPSIPAWYVPEAQPFCALVSAPVAACPPTPLALPLSPGRSTAACGQPPGSPPPAIRPALLPHPLLEWLGAVRRLENQWLAGSYRSDTGGVILGRQAARLDRADDLQVLWHGRWAQPVPSRNAPEPLLVQAGRAYDGVHTLEGTIDITLGRYLHFNARLWLRTVPTAGAGAPASAGIADAPRTAGDGALASSTTPTPYMVLEESRAMRSGTLDYLDHPRLGVLVRADPMQPPDWLVAASIARQTAERGD